MIKQISKIKFSSKHLLFLYLVQLLIICDDLHQLLLASVHNQFATMMLVEITHTNNRYPICMYYRPLAYPINSAVETKMNHHAEKINETVFVFFLRPISYNLFTKFWK